MSAATIDSTVVKFNTTVSRLLRNIEAMLSNETDKANIDRLSKRISVVKATGLSEPLSLTYKFFLAYLTQIRTRDEDFFMKVDAKSEASKYSDKEISSQDEFVFDLIAALRKSYAAASKQEQDKLYSDVKKLLLYSLDWAKYINTEV